MSVISLLKMGSPGRGCGPRHVSPILRSLALVCLMAFVCGCREQIVHDLSEPDVNRLIARLTVAGLAAERVQTADGAWALAVAEDDAVRALSLIDIERLVPKRIAETAPSSSLVPSADEQRFHFERSLSHELEESLRELNGVVEARVHLNLPESDNLQLGGRAQKVTSASVLLTIKSDFSSEISQIGQLIAGASGIDASRVTVITNKLVSAERPAETMALIPRAPVSEEFPIVWLVSLGGVLAAAGGFSMLRSLLAQRRALRLREAS